MSYDSIEQSVEDGYSVELYTFEGSFSTYRLTSFATDFNFGGFVYTATPGLGRSNTDSTAVGGSSSGELEIEMPFSTKVAQEYAFSDIPPTLKFTLHRGHASDADEQFRVLWTGDGGAWSVKGRQAKLKVPSTFAVALNTSFPSRRWQSPCNHLLYDSQCTLNRADWSFSSTITEVSGDSITVASCPWVDTEGIGGEIIDTTTGERRTIRSHVGNAIRIKLPFAAAKVGDLVTLYQGCDHSALTCRDKFNNLDEYGGCNLVPSKNPFGGTLR